jgi:molybdopterin molybdotransferase
MKRKIGFTQARKIILENVPLLPLESMPLLELQGRIAAQDLHAVVDSPSIDASLKDGYAVYSDDVAEADENNPARLTLKGFQAAGDPAGELLQIGSTVRVTTGAPMPPGAQAVLAGEYAREESDEVVCWRDAEPGRNVLPRGTDVKAGEIVVRKGETLHPALIGLLAAAGLDKAPVYRRPRVAVIGTGDEIVAPGEALKEGRLYASNLVESVSWLKSFGMSVQSTVVPDQAGKMEKAIQDLVPQVDAFVTSGGAFGSERDLMLGLLNDLGWEGLFHRVRLGPGKAAGFGLLEGKPFFLLPGGPPSYEATFLLLALPGLMAMSGHLAPVFTEINARLEKDITGQIDWTQSVHARLYKTDDQGFAVQPLKSVSRLSSMARKNALILLPEGTTEYKAGREIPVIQLVNGLLDPVGEEHTGPVNNR